MIDFKHYDLELTKYIKKKKKKKIPLISLGFNNKLDVGDNLHIFNT